MIFQLETADNQSSVFHNKCFVAKADGKMQHTAQNDAFLCVCVAGEYDHRGQFTGRKKKEKWWNERNAAGSYKAKSKTMFPC